MPRYVTREKLATSPATQGLDEQGVTELIADAERVYTWLKAHEWAEEDEVIQAANAANMPLERVQRAMEFLMSEGRVARFGVARAARQEPTIEEQQSGVVPGSGATAEGKRVAAKPAARRRRRST